MTKKNTKRALLASVVSMLLCVSMLIGSTFAWFTDNASTNVNEIQSGTLRVDLVDEKGASLEGKFMSFEKAGTNELWEPGATWDLQKAYVKNNGNLDLVYRIVITGIKGDAKLNEVIDWTIKVGNTEVILENGISQEFDLGSGALSEALSISGKMQETAGNDYQGLKIEGITLKVEARQADSEFDSYNNTYDENSEYGADYPENGSGSGSAEGTHVTDAATLETALAANTPVVVLDNDISVSDKIATVTADSILDLGGNELNISIQNGLTVAEGVSLTLQNGTINCSFEETTTFSAAVYVSPNAKLVMENGTIINTHNPQAPNTWTDAKGVILRDNAEFTMNGGVINAYGTNSATGINSTYGSNSVINFNGGIINVVNGGAGYGIGIYAQSGTTLNLNGGTINVQATAGIGEAIDIGSTTTVNFNSPINVNVYKSTYDGNRVTEDDEVILNAVGTGIIVNEK